MAKNHKSNGSTEGKLENKLRSQPEGGMSVCHLSLKEKKNSFQILFSPFRQ